MNDRRNASSPGEKRHYAYLDESGEFREGSRPSLVAGFVTATEPRRLDELIGKTLDQTAAKFGLMPEQVRHLTELRASGFRELPEFLQTVLKGWLRELPDLKFFVLKSTELQRVTAPDVFYVDLVAEAFSALVVAQPVGGEWVFCPAARVKAAYQGRRVSDTDPCFSPTEYAPTIEQRIRDRIAAFGLGSTPFLLHPESPRFRTALVAADYIANCRWQLTRPSVPVAARDLWREIVAPSLLFELSADRLTLHHQVLAAAQVGQWDAAFIELARGAWVTSSIPPRDLRTAVPGEWAAIAAAMRADESLSTTFSDLLDSVESLIEEGQEGPDPRSWFKLLDDLAAERPEPEDAARSRFAVAHAEAAWAVHQGLTKAFHTARERALACYSASDADEEELLGRIELESLSALSSTTELDLDSARSAADAAISAHRERLAAAALVPFAAEAERDGSLSKALSTRAWINLVGHRLGFPACSEASVRADCTEAIAQAEEPSEEEAARIVLARLLAYQSDPSFVEEIQALVALVDVQAENGFRHLLSIGNPEMTALAVDFYTSRLPLGQTEYAPDKFRDFLGKYNLVPDRRYYGLKAAACYRNLAILALAAGKRQEAAILLSEANATAGSFPSEPSPARELFRFKLRLAELTLGKDSSNSGGNPARTLARFPALSAQVARLEELWNLARSGKPEASFASYCQVSRLLPW